MREALFDGRYEEAQRLCDDHLRGDPLGTRPYLPFCDLPVDEQDGRDGAGASDGGRPSPRSTPSPAAGTDSSSADCGAAAAVRSV
ncbi:hypothetical protein [Candidatus Halobonum tyrrellensis]|uniref:Alpha-L-fucosidase n=1 Tax=Candidatus Halobonum tyrrellensis G22 TaxID=1324957 RepID=V4HJQ2_9EURY|nr:hypothetical protein [Candidatus Halobonum tyrrellensis]ESP89993.1 alpha-L-fucosidase [Candidatus Halobonum tyrrellensis G22]